VGGSGDGGSASWAPAVDGAPVDVLLDSGALTGGAASGAAPAVGGGGGALFASGSLAA
jgi:hypothetical protein